MIRRLAVAGIALVAVAAFAACSSDSESVEDEISDQIKSTYDLPEEPDTNCPEDAEANEGETFDCTSTIDGVDITMSVEFTSDSTFNITPTGLFSDDEFIPYVIGAAATNPDTPVNIAELDCPGEGYVVIGEGSTIECTGTDVDGVPGTAVVGLDADGLPTIVELIPG